MATKDKVISAGTGRRKTACARVTLVEGDGKWTVNRQPLEEYITSEALRDYLKQPIAIAGFDASKVNVVVFAKGGGCMTRDSPMKERKKPGQQGARKRFQFSKR